MKLAEREGDSFVSRDSHRGQERESDSRDVDFLSNALRFDRSRARKNRKTLFSGLHAHTRTRVYANPGGCCVRAPRAIHYDERWKRACAGELNGHARHLIRAEDLYVDRYRLRL